MKLCLQGDLNIMHLKGSRTEFINTPHTIPSLAEGLLSRGVTFSLSLMAEHESWLRVLSRDSLEVLEVLHPSLLHPSWLALRPTEAGEPVGLLGSSSAPGLRRWPKDQPPSDVLGGSAPQATVSRVQRFLLAASRKAEVVFRELRSDVVRFRIAYGTRGLGKR